MKLSDRIAVSVVAGVLSLGLVACGSDDGAGEVHDAGPDAAPDAAADAAPDAASDAAIDEAESHTYVVDTITLPLDADQAEALGFDLDGDGTVDNQLGNVLIALVNASGSLDFQGMIDQRVDGGEILLLAELRATALTTAADASFSMYLGENPSPAACTDPLDPLTCRQHLDGNGRFDVAASTPADQTVVGDISSGTFTGGPGQLIVQIAFGVGTIDLPLVQAQARITGIGEGALGAGTIGGAVRDADVQSNLIPGMWVAVVDTIELDCTGAGADCGCVAGSTGSTLLGIFDEDGNCAVPLDEFRNSSLIATLLRPDVDTDGDGKSDAFSAGVGVTAVAGTFTPPS